MKHEWFRVSVLLQVLILSSVAADSQKRIADVVVREANNESLLPSETEVSFRKTPTDPESNDTFDESESDGNSSRVGPLPVSREAMEELAEELCSELYYQKHMIAACRQNFSEVVEAESGAVSLRVRCRGERSTTVELKGGGGGTFLVLLLPSGGWARNITRIPHVVIEPPDMFGTIFHGARGGGARLYVAALLRGHQSEWLPGPIMPARRALAADPAPYRTDLTMLYDSVDNRSRRVDALLTWDAADDDDSCFEVTNLCNNDDMGNFFHKKIGPESLRRVVLRALPLDDACTLTVRGQRTVRRSYRTPRCAAATHCLPLPESPRNVTLWSRRVREGGEDDAWDVRVAWGAPTAQPDRYTVTLHARGDLHQTAPGNTSEVWFHNVSMTGAPNGTDGGARMIAASVVAHNRAGTAHASARAVLVDEEEAIATSTVAALGSTVAALVLCSVALAAGALWWRRRRSARNKFHFEALEKEWRAYSSEPGAEGGAAPDEWEINSAALVLHETVGEGAFGVVRRATLQHTNQQVAVKMLKDYPTLEEVRSFLAEMELMKCVGAHPHVVSLLGVCSGRRPRIVAEYCPRGDLLSYLRRAWDVMVSKRNAKYYNNNILEASYRHELFDGDKTSKMAVNKLYELEGADEAELTPGDLLSFCRQVAKGMEFLASNRVVHRDLAARNVLVAADRTLKIADFGLSRDVYQDNQYRQKGDTKMPVKWMALESLTHRIYTTQSDVWSFGVVMWEVVTLGGVPYPGVPPPRLLPLLQRGERLPRPPNTDPQLYEVMQSCWRAVPCARPTFSALLSRLDALLHAAAPHHYLQLELTPPPPPPHPPATRHARCVSALAKYARWGTGGWLRERYERPLPPAASNQYTQPPAPSAHT